MAFRAVHEDGDGEQIVSDRQLAAGEDRAGRDTELMIAGFAFPKVTGLVGVEREATAFRTMGLALGVGPADALERLTSFLIRHTGTVARESDRAAVDRRKCCAICDSKISHLVSLSIAKYQI